MRRLTPILALALLAAGCGGGGSKTSAIPSGGGAAPTASTTTEAAAPAAPGCKKVARPPAQSAEVRLPKPTTKLDAAKHYTATVVTNCGTFAFALDVRKAPQTTASIAYLAGRHFYDKTIFHRIAKGFVIQGGDPTGTGSGGPGYSTVDKPPASTKYTKGVVAMAKTGDEASGTAGSQFFVVTGAEAELPPDYAVVGKVTKGMDVVDRIGKLGDDAEQPTATVEILSFRVSPGA